MRHLERQDRLLYHEFSLLVEVLHPSGEGCCSTKTLHSFESSVVKHYTRKVYAVNKNPIGSLGAQPRLVIGKRMSYNPLICSTVLQKSAQMNYYEGRPFGLLECKGPPVPKLILGTVDL